MLEPALITTRVTSILDKLQVRYFIGGSFASTLHGMVRTTQDSDIVADLRQEHVGAFSKELNEEFYIDGQMIVNAINRRSSFNIIHKDSFFKVDVFIPIMRPFVVEELSRAQRQVLSVDPLAEALVATSEDTVLAKLEWYRLGGEVSERQWRDILGILEVQGENIDLNYLWRWARELMVNDLLEKALADSAL
ncbi:MAG: hypothetical protein MUC85_04395 [Anaerolineales bacterium]|jgi:hypothetical protein|nr:hypothetical protein [Anaerolineales bacterium]